MKINKKILFILASILSLVFYFMFQAGNKENDVSLNLFVDKVSADAPATEGVVGGEGVQGSAGESSGESSGESCGSEGEGEGEGGGSL